MINSLCVLPAPSFCGTVEVHRTWSPPVVFPRGMARPWSSPLIASCGPQRPRSDFTHVPQETGHREGSGKAAAFGARAVALIVVRFERVLVFPSVVLFALSVCIYWFRKCANALFSLSFCPSRTRARVSCLEQNCTISGLWQDLSTLSQ